MKHVFGGSWTDQKVRILAEYLNAYTTALSRTPFNLVYIDAFAGTGQRTAVAEADEDRLFDVDVAPLVAGSAKVALEVERPFDRYFFVERDRRRFEGLQELCRQYPDLRSRIALRQEEANGEIRRICAEVDWRNSRAVMFLDPYGMSVDFETLEMVAATQAVDLWYLFPTGMGINRMTPRSGIIDPAWRDRLRRVTGDPNFMEAFYKPLTHPDLFDGDVERKEKVTSTEEVEKYILDRLNTIFQGGVAPSGWRLVNPRNNQCMYLLLFCVSNPRAASVALRIANYLIRERLPR